MSMDIISNNMQAVQRIMRRFVENQPLAASASVVSADGVLITGFPKDPDAELSLGGMVSAAMASTPTIVGELNSNKLYSMVVLADRGGILFFQLPDELVVAVKLAKPGKIGALFAASQGMIKDILSLPKGG